MTGWEGGGGGGGDNSTISTDSNTPNNKRRYGNPDQPQGTKTLLVTKNRKIRHSQACDRCRLKKIKCDGLKPSCSQCEKAKFKCKTSDRLTRRGFPRGYTEMLETEVVRLQKLLDEQSGSQGGGACKVTLDDAKKLKEETTAPYEREGRGDGDYSNSSKEQVLTEPQFPFINDTFHYYDNFIDEENYLGHRTWEILSRADDKDDSGADLHNEILKSSHIATMANLLQLQQNSLWLPKFLTTKYDDNLPHLQEMLKMAIANFNKFQNSLMPLLYPSDKWTSNFSQQLNSNDFPDPITLLAFIYIVQINWSCFDDSILFTVTKMICSSSPTSLKNLQCLLLGCFYFMGGHHSARNRRSKIFASELLHLAYSIVLDLGLYINSNRLLQLKEQRVEEADFHDHRIVTFWTFQFLDSWWSLINGLPKSNFIVDEFHPRSISSLNVPYLKPFSLLLNFITESLDGCNLLHILSNGNSNGKSKLIYLTESFRQSLVQWKLYHQLQDHEDDFDSNDPRMSLCLTKPDVIEIQLTLFYLIISFISDERITNNNFSHESTVLSSNLEDIAYEIISLYYLLLVDQSHSEQPLQLTILHILPCPNKELINHCLRILNDWAISPQGDNELEVQLNWKYNKYQNLLAQWCQFYYADEPDDPMLARLSLSYKIHLNQEHVTHPPLGNKTEYLQKVQECTNNTVLNIGRPNLLRSSSHAIMDQFDMFSQINSPKSIFNNIHSSKFPNREVQNNGKPETQLTQNDTNNIIDMSNFRSQILIEHEETDDGYAEDDDEDEDEDDMKPLEIPFSSKRTGSLFHNKQNLPPLHRQHNQETVSGDRRTLDHIILENNSFVSQQSPVKKMHHDAVKPSKNCPRSEPLQNPSYSSDSSNAYHHYSVHPPPRKALSTNSGGNTVTNNTRVSVLPPPPPPRHDTLFDQPLKLDKNSSTNSAYTNSAHTPQIVETPRAFVDMLLQSPGQQRTIVRPQPSCNKPPNENHKVQVKTNSNLAESAELYR